MVQDQGGVSHILGEWIEEGQAGDVVQQIVREASISSPSPIVVVIGAQHFDKWKNHGLNQALTRCGIRARPGGELQAGRAAVQDLLRRRLRGVPGLVVSDRCRFTLNGMTSGFAYPVQFNVVAKEPASGIYRTLIEGLEAFMASAIVADEDDAVGNFQVTSDGRRYRSAMRT
jgi:hypothetical protein